MMKKLLFLCTLFVLGFAYSAHACENATTTILSFTDNQNGTYTYAIEICVEFNGTEGAPDYFGAGFDGANIIAFAPASIFTSDGDEYVGAIDGNGDVFWTFGGFIPVHNMNTLCTNVELTVDALPTALNVSYHDTYPDPSCYYTQALNTPCSITSVSAGTQSACDPATNTYTQEVTITYLDAPTTGDIIVNGQSFPVGTSPQTVTLTGLVADGNTVNVSVGFSDDPVCSYTEVNVFTAPMSCLGCSIDALFGAAQSNCDPITGTFSQDIIVQYSNPPSTGTLDVNGQSFPIGTSPQVVTLMGLPANGQSVDVTASFSEDAACTFTEIELYDAPVDCSPVCAITAISAGTPTACDPATNTYSVDVTVTFENEPTAGTLDINGQSFAIGTSPQMVTLVNLTADGMVLDVTASFSEDVVCTFTEAGLVTAPANCSNVCSGSLVFSDTNPGSGHYGNNEDYTVTYCSGSSDLLQFDFDCSSCFTTARIHPSDTLYIYDGIGTGGDLLAKATGNPANSNRLDYFTAGFGGSFDQFLSKDTCITFRFVSDAADVEDGWQMGITCVPPVVCADNPPASDLFLGAPFICNLDGYCGTTSGDFGADYPANLASSNGNGAGFCPDPTLVFGGTIQNNSWLQFQAADVEANFQFTVTGCTDGIQVAVLEYDSATDSFTRKTPCDLSDDNNNGTFTLTATDLTIGVIYYIMVDGNAGSVCDYEISVLDDAQVVVIDAGDDQTICNGTSTTLTVSGPAGAMYEWTGSDGFGPMMGTSITVTPAATTTYTVELIDGLICTSETDEVVVTIEDCGSCSVDDLVAGTQLPCSGMTQTYDQEVIVYFTNPPATGDLIVNGQSFPIGTSPQTVTLTNLSANGQPVSVTASFSDDAACTLSETDLFVAPIKCVDPCSVIDATLGVQSTCAPTTNTYTQELTISYANPPFSGSLSVNGQTFPIDYFTYQSTITLTGLPADSNPVTVIVSFTDDLGCSLLLTDLFTAPTSCVSCSDGIQNGDETGIDCGGATCPPCQNCTVSQYYSGSVLTDVYQTSSTIGSNAVVPNGEDVTFLSECIALDEGFEVEIGALFLADPVPCVANVAGGATQHSSAAEGELRLHADIDGRNAHFAYWLPQAMFVSLTLQKIDGSYHQTLIGKENQAEGLHKIDVTMRDLPVGIYILTLQTPHKAYYKKIILK